MPSSCANVCCTSLFMISVIALMGVPIPFMFKECYALPNSLRLQLILTLALTGMNLLLIFTFLFHKIRYLLLYLIIPNFFGTFYLFSNVVLEVVKDPEYEDWATVYAIVVTACAKLIAFCFLGALAGFFLIEDSIVQNVFMRPLASSLTKIFMIALSTFCHIKSLEFDDDNEKWSWVCYICILVFVGSIWVAEKLWKNTDGDDPRRYSRLAVVFGCFYALVYCPFAITWCINGILSVELENWSQYSMHNLILLLLVTSPLCVTMVIVAILGMGYGVAMGCRFCFRAKRPESIRKKNLTKVLLTATSAILDEKECSMCKEEFQKGDNLIQFDSCNHVFHAVCVGTWSEKNDMCPLCVVSSQQNLENSLNNASITISDTCVKKESV